MASDDQLRTSLLSELSVSSFEHENKDLDPMDEQLYDESLLTATKQVESLDFDSQASKVWRRNMVKTLFESGNLIQYDVILRWGVTIFLGFLVGVIGFSDLHLSIFF